jgi:hydrogenase maturation factor
MPIPAWRVEFDRAAVCDLRKLGADAEARVLRYLRQRIAASDDPRRLAHALTEVAEASGATVSVTIASLPLSRMTDSSFWSWPSGIAGTYIADR